MTRPLRAVLYARRSSPKQADRDLSVPAWLDACPVHAQRQGWLAPAEHHDDGISGFEDERRPAFRRMLADHRGVVEAVTFLRGRHGRSSETSGADAFSQIAATAGNWELRRGAARPRGGGRSGGGCGGGRLGGSACGSGLRVSGASCLDIAVEIP